MKVDYKPEEIRYCGPLGETHLLRPTNKHSLSYLAAPYTHKDPKILKARVHAINKVAGLLIAGGTAVYSPISMTHPIAEQAGNHFDHDFWLQLDEAFLERADELIVLMLPGYHVSLGVLWEIDWCKRRGMAIKYLDFVDGLLTFAEWKACGWRVGKSG